MRTAIIIVNYNGILYNDACIRSVLESDWEGELRIYVVDNGSFDGSAESLEQTWGEDDRVTLLRMGENLGFSAANNAGIRRALEDGADYVMLLNNDTFICSDMISELLRAKERHAQCIAVPKIYFADRPEVIWSAGGGFRGIVKKPVSYGENQPDAPEYDVEKRCENGNGCCFLISREEVQKIGLLEEAFFLYYEDTDYFMRAGENGIGVVYAPAAKMYHKVNASTKGNDNPACVYYITRNWLMFARRHLHAGRFAAFLVYFAFNRCAWAVIWAAQGKWERVKALGRGAIDFERGKSGKYDG